MGKCTQGNYPARHLLWGGIYISPVIHPTIHSGLINLLLCYTWNCWRCKTDKTHTHLILSSTCYLVCILITLYALPCIRYPRNILTPVTSRTTLVTSGVTRGLHQRSKQESNIPNRNPKIQTGIQYPKQESNIPNRNPKIQTEIQYPNPITLHHNQKQPGTAQNKLSGSTPHAFSNTTYAIAYPTPLKPLDFNPKDK